MEIKMNGFRSICFVHTIEDSYVTCYLKQFFKWTGFVYLEYIPGSMGSSIDILRKPENQKFDMMVSLNHALQDNNGTDIADCYGDRFYELNFQLQEKAEDVMERLMDQLKDTILRNTDIFVFEKLYELYQEFGMASVLYEYTMILLNGMDDSFFVALDNKFEQVLYKMEQFEKCQKHSAQDRGMWEYFLFAKYFCQRKANELCLFKDWILYYPIDELLKNLNEIYRYDDGFHRVEYLKAKAAEQSLMHRVYAKGYYFKGLEKSSIEVCKSYLFYQLGKWLEKNQQAYEAGIAFINSYKTNPANLKAVFKLAVGAKRTKDLDAERHYLSCMVENWRLFHEKKQMLPLMELEYAYKSYMLMDKLMRKDISDKRFYNIGKEILQFTETMGKEARDDYFIYWLYTDDERKKISHAIALRMDINCKELVKEEGN